MGVNPSPVARAGGFSACAVHIPTPQPIDLSLQALDLVLPLGLTWFDDGDDAAATPEKEPEVHD